jgi:hypothetical protein
MLDKCLYVITLLQIYCTLFQLDRVRVDDIDNLKDLDLVLTSIRLFTSFFKILVVRDETGKYRSKLFVGARSYMLF